jgi:hypothetical protein
MFFGRIWEHLGQVPLGTFTYERALKSKWAKVSIFVRLSV